MNRGVRGGRGHHHLGGEGRGGRGGPRGGRGRSGPRGGRGGWRGRGGGYRQENGDWTRRDPPWNERGRERGGGGYREHRRHDRRDDENVPPAPVRRFRFGWKYMNELVTKSPRQIATDLGSKRDDFSAFLSQGQRMSPEMLRLVLKATALGCKSDTAAQSVNDLLNSFLSSWFLSIQMSPYLMQRRRSGAAHEVDPEIESEVVRDLITILEQILQRFPSRAGELMIVDVLKRSVPSLSLPEEEETDIMKRIDELLEDQEDAVDRRAAAPAAAAAAGGPSNDFNIMADPEDDFTDMTVVPTSEEITLNDRPFLRPNIRRGAFRDLKQYLDIQFRLLREDFVGPLREGIAALDDMDQRRLKPTDLRVYRRVRVVEPVCTTRGLTHRLAFDVSRMRRVRWNYTRRLIFGSLLCLSSDNFRTMKLAVVTNRRAEDLANGNVDVRFVNGLADLADVQMSETEFIMAESPAYYEAYRHVLERLQTIKDDLPFQKYIVKCRPDDVVAAPRYLRAERNDGVAPSLDLRSALGCKHVAASFVRPLSASAWPPLDNVDLDESQYEALKVAMTREFALVQGPPGTGKTYIGLKIVEALVKNRDVWDPRKSSPMLIVCYTNHALDQFLEGILKFLPDDIVRVGGRSNSEKLKKFNLASKTRHLRSSRDVPQAIYHGRCQAFREVMELQKDVQSSWESLASGKKGVVGIRHFLPVEGCKLINFLSDGGSMYESRGYSRLDEWLGIVCSKETANDEKAKTPADNAKTDEPEKETDDDAEDEEEEGDAEVDEEAERLEAERRIEGTDYDQIIREENRPNDEAPAPAPEQEVAPEGETDDDSWTTVTMSKRQRYFKIRERRTLPPMAEEEVGALNEYDLWDLNEEGRWRLYNYWMNKLQTHYEQQCNVLYTKFEQACTRLKEQSEQEDLHILQSATVIGMTTTGAAKYRSLLQEIRPRIVVVEEAAEVYEAHIVTTLSPATEHLILIGDHQQLRPSPHVYRLAQKFDLDVSMFERMRNNDMPCRRLNTQHRMRPEIRRLMNHIYDDLHDHESVKSYGNVPGVRRNIFFVDHRSKESENEDLRSHLNRHEAAFVTSFCLYLIQQNVAGSRITILTTYTGQLLEIKELMRTRRGVFSGVRVTAVDNYQGEENDIIILSLVRSNDAKKIGFLNISNRVCVALSRAKMGFYCIGNMTMLAKTNDLWSLIRADMIKDGGIGRELELCCQNHPRTVTTVSKASDFDKAPEGGCTKPCEFRLHCGHVCSLSCHPYDPQHKEYKCKKPCARTCPREHACSRRCYQQCGNCTVKVPRVLSECGHVQLVPCHQENESFICREPCPKLLACGHSCVNRCGDWNCTQRCLVSVTKRFECGHTLEVPCHLRHENGLCSEPCVSLLECGHPCTGTCGECLGGRRHKSCRSQCGRTLVCSHECAYPCTKNCPPCEASCENRCEHSACRNKCGELCSPCKERCTWECRHHRCTKLCSEECDRPRCDRACLKKLDCGHRCIGLCGEPCPSKCRTCDRDEVTEIFFGDEDEPNARFVELEDCHHIFEVKALDRWMDQTQTDDDGGLHIGLKQCPRCKTAVRRNLRYGNVIKRALQDIEAVKRTMIQQSAEMERTKKRLKREVLDLITTLAESPLFSDRINAGVVRHARLAVASLASKESIVFLLDDDGPCGKIMHRIRDRPTPEELWTAENQILLLPKVAELGTKIAKAIGSGGDDVFRLECRKLSNELRTLIDVVMVAQLTAETVNDIQVQLLTVENKFHFHLIQYRIRSRALLLPDTEKEYLRKVKMIFRLDKLTMDQIETVKEALKIVAEFSGAPGISDVERIQIVKAIGLSHGHWYKCPQGHIYAIGECGGANQGGMCPECKAPIGGVNHALAQGNQHAPEMDGSSYAAWSDEANMAFDPRQFMN